MQEARSQVGTRGRSADPGSQSPDDALPSRRWWQRAVLFETYVRSFQDGNGDGGGDLPGIVEQLDYLAWLGIDAISLTPVYPSPTADFGYDVTDYTDFDSLFGDLDVFDRLVAEARRRNLKVLVDLVPNHSSSLQRLVGDA